MAACARLCGHTMVHAMSSRDTHVAPGPALHCSRGSTCCHAPPPMTTGSPSDSSRPAAVGDAPNAVPCP